MKPFDFRYFSSRHAPTRSLQASRSRDRPVSVRSTCGFFHILAKRPSLPIVGAALPFYPDRTSALSEDLPAAVAKTTLGGQFKNNMYNAHRGIGQQPTNNSNNRLSELFDQIRREFDVHAQDRAGEHDQNSMSFQVIESSARLYPLLKLTLPRYLVPNKTHTL